MFRPVCDLCLMQALSSVAHIVGTKGSGQSQQFTGKPLASESWAAFSLTGFREFMTDPAAPRREHLTLQTFLAIRRISLLRFSTRAEVRVIDLLFQRGDK